MRIPFIGRRSGHDLSGPNRSRGANGAPALASEVPPWRGLAASPLGLMGVMGAIESARCSRARLSTVAIGHSRRKREPGPLVLDVYSTPAAKSSSDRAHQVAVVVVVEQARSQRRPAPSAARRPRRWARSRPRSGASPTSGRASAGPCGRGRRPGRARAPSSQRSPVSSSTSRRAASSHVLAGLELALRQRPIVVARAMNDRHLGPSSRPRTTRPPAARTSGSVNRDSCEITANPCSRTASSTCSPVLGAVGLQHEPDPGLAHVQVDSLAQVDDVEHVRALLGDRAHEPGERAGAVRDHGGEHQPAARRPSRRAGCTRPAARRRRCRPRAGRRRRRPRAARPCPRAARRPRPRPHPRRPASSARAAGPSPGRRRRRRR